MTCPVCQDKQFTILIRGYVRGRTSDELQPVWYHYPCHECAGGNRQERLQLFVLLQLTKTCQDRQLKTGARKLYEKQ